MNSQYEINVNNEQLKARLQAESIPFEWKDVSVRVESVTPVWVAEVIIPTPHGALELWISYDEYLPQFLIEEAATGERFEAEMDEMTLDNVISALQLILPTYDEGAVIGSNSGVG